MRKYLVIILCLYLCSCVVKLDGNDSVSHFPIPQKKKSITLIFNNPPSVEHAYETMKKRYAEHFVKSNLFSEVLLDKTNKTDYTLYITDRNTNYMPVHCTLTSIISGFTFTIIPGVCNCENIRQIDLKLIDNKTQKVQNNYHLEGMWMSLGVLVILAMPFTDNVFNAEDRTSDNVVLRTYYMMEAFE